MDGCLSVALGGGFAVLRHGPGGHDAPGDHDHVSGRGRALHGGQAARGVVHLRRRRRASTRASAPSRTARRSDTATAGQRTFTVTARDTSATSSWASARTTSSDTGGDVPATLTLTLGASGFAAFMPGVGESTRRRWPQILSTAGDATLTVVDPSATQTGHLVNGTYSLAQALRAAGTSSRGRRGGRRLRRLGRIRMRRDRAP